MVWYSMPLPLVTAKWILLQLAFFNIFVLSFGCPIPELISIVEVDKAVGQRAHKHAYTFQKLMLSSVDIRSLFHAFGDTKTTYLEHIVEVCASVLYFKFGTVLQHRNCAIFYCCQSDLPYFRVIRQIQVTFTEFGFSSMRCQS